MDTVNIESEKKDILCNIEELEFAENRKDHFNPTRGLKLRSKTTTPFQK